MSRARGEVWTFGVAALAVLAFLFRDAFLNGGALGQTDLLQQFPPWLSHRPLGWQVRNPLLYDVPTVFYPFLSHARDVIRAGHLPLWSSSVGAGEPFFASFQSAVFSPFTLPVYVLPFSIGLLTTAAARLLAGGIGMYLFLRNLGVSIPAAAFGGAAFLLNAFSIVWLEHPMSAVAAMAPWLLVAVKATMERRDRRAVGGLAVATAVLLLAGHPETAFKILLLAGFFAVFCIVKKGRLIRGTLLLVAGLSLGALFSAVQLVPFVEYALQSRVLAARSLSDSPLFTNPPSAFVTAFVPTFFGSPLRHRYLLQTNFFEQQAYPGVVVWVLAAASMAHRRLRSEAIFFVMAGLLAALIMYGTWVARVAIVVVPPLRVAALARFGLILITCLVIVGAIGLDAVLERARSRTGTPVAILCTSAAASVVVIVAAFLVTMRPLLIESRQWPVTLAALEVPALLVMATVLLAWLARAVNPKVAGAVAISLITLEMLAFSDGLHPLVPRGSALPPVPELDVIRRDRGVFRVAGWVDTLPPNTAMMYGLQDVRVYDGMIVGRYGQLLDAAFHWTGASHQLVNVATPHMLDLLNLKYILAPAGIDLPGNRYKIVLAGPTRVYENLTVQPRAFLVGRFQVTSGTVAIRMIRDGVVDLRHVALLEHAPALDAWPAGADETGIATIDHYQDDDVRITVDADGPRLLVLTDVFYSGWKATVDGRPSPILRADVAFRAVSVPAGRHAVRFRYRPSSVGYGLAGSVVGVLITGFLVVPRSRRASAPTAIPTGINGQGRARSSPGRMCP